MSWRDGSVELAEAFLEEVLTAALQRRDGSLSAPRLGRDGGTAVRVWTEMGDRLACRSGLGARPLRECLEEAGTGTGPFGSRSAAAGAEAFAAEGEFLRLSEPSFRGLCLEWLKETEEAARRRGAVSCRGTIREWIRRVGLLLPDGTFRRRTDRWSVLTLRLSRARGGGEGWFRAGGPDIRALPAGVGPIEAAARAWGDLEETAAAIPLPAPARMDVVFSGEAAGGFLHEVCGHLRESDLTGGRNDPLAPQDGGRLLPEEIVVFDDPGCPGFAGSMPFDDEGVPCRRNLLIGSGSPGAFLLDRRSARRLGGEPTGSGRRESFRDPPLPRLGNLFLRGGRADPGDAVGSCEEGVFAGRVEAGRVEPETGRFRVVVRRGRAVRNGRLGPPLQPFEVTGTASAALRGIERVECDRAAVGVSGRCVKEGQGLLTGLSSPPIRVRGLSVSPVS